MEAESRLLVQAWVTRQLNVGVASGKLWEDVASLRDRLQHQETRRLIDTLLEEMGIQKTRPPEHAVVYEEFGLLTPPPSVKSPTSTFTKKSTWSLFGKKEDSQKPAPGPSKWFGHTRSTHSLSKLLPPACNADRRPSLPVFSMTNLPSSANLLTTPSTAGSSPCLSISDYTVVQTTPRTPRHFSTTSEMSTIMSSSHPEEVRANLTDHLLGMRYRLTRPGGTWFLGEGKSIAQQVVDAMDARLRGKHEQADIERILGDIRKTFCLPHSQVFPDYTSPLISEVPGLYRQREDSDQTLSSLSSLKRDDTSPFTCSSRDTFDLDQYIRDISWNRSQEGEREELNDQPQPLPPHLRRGSAGAASLLSFASRGTTGSRAEKARIRSSTLSAYAFSIREAKKEYPLEAVSVERALRFDTPATPPHGTANRREPMHFASRSNPNFIDRYTTLPPPISILRTRNHAEPLPRSLSDTKSVAHFGATPLPTLTGTLSAPNLSSKVPDDLLSVLAALDESPTGSTSAPSTFVQRGPDGGTKARRQWHRQCAIVDQIEVSPSRNQYDHYHHDDLFPPLSSPFNGLQLEIALRDAQAEGAKPKVPIRQSSLTNLPKLQKTDPPVPLSAIMSFFVRGDHAGQGNVFEEAHGLTAGAVEKELERFIELEMRRNEALGFEWDIDAKRRAAWVLEQVGNLVRSLPNNCEETKADPGSYTTHA